MIQITSAIVEVVSSCVVIVSSCVVVLKPSILIEFVNYSLMDDKKILSIINGQVRAFILSRPPHIRQYEDELRNYVLSSCWERQDSYDPSKSQAYTFFYRRISGAIQDWVRHNCAFSRNFHEKNPNVRLCVLSSITNDQDVEFNPAEDPESVIYSSIKYGHNDKDGTELDEFLEREFADIPRVLTVIKNRREGYSNKEISTILGCSSATVSTLLKRARERLSSFNNLGAVNIGQYQKSIQRRREERVLRETRASL